MFESLSARLQRALKNLSGQGRINEQVLKASLREVRIALLEADVHVGVVKALLEAVREKALGEEVLQSLTPGQQVVKIVRDELESLLGGGGAEPLSFASKPPTVMLLVGLQGSGKTTTTAKLGKWLTRSGRYPYLVPVDVYRPAAIEQLVRVGRAAGLKVHEHDGSAKPLDIARAGVTEAYRIGGAQAIAALAFGTNTISPVDKIVGPGNAWVAAAKRQVFGTVGIDMVAGPSEILVVADGANDADWIAIDLLAQAEHDADAQSILITDDREFADRVELAVEARLKTLPRAEIAGASWAANGAVIVVDDLGEAPALIDAIAPEHLELAVENPSPLADAVNNAGAIFLGRFTPEAVGDYVAGPNHVLPTGGTARFSSGLSVFDFIKRTSLISCDADALSAVGPAAMTLAEAEGLDAHALSIAIRLNLPLSE